MKITVHGTYVLVSLQGKKFKDKLPAHPGPVDEDYDDSSDDSIGSQEATDQFPLRPRRQSDRAGEGFVSSIRGLFNLQRKKAKALVLRTRRGPEELDLEQRSSSSDDEGNAANPARSPRGQSNITKAKRTLLRLQARKNQKVDRIQKGEHCLSVNLFNLLFRSESLAFIEQVETFFLAQVSLHVFVNSECLVFPRLSSFWKMQMVF